jgi:hypothetical protein
MMLLAYDSAAQIALWGASWAVSIQRTAWSGDPGSSPPDQCPEAPIVEQTRIEQHRSLVVRFAIAAGADNTWRIDSDSAGHRDPLASRWIPSLLALEIETTRWPAADLIREMSIANPLWGAPRVHGELLKLGIDVGQTTVAKYMAKRRRPPAQGWRTFLHNHADGIASMDLFVVPTISFRLLYGLLILQHGRRQIVWLGGHRAPRPLNGSRASSRSPMLGQRHRDTSSVTATPSTATFSSAVFRRWAFVIGQQRRGRHGKSRAVEAVGSIIAKPFLGGLHHQYVRIWFATGTSPQGIARWAS